MRKVKEFFRKMSKKQLVIFIVGVLFLTITVSYAYFTATSNYNGVGVTTKGQITSYAGTELITTGVLEFNDTGILPGHQNISSIEVNARSDADGVNIIYNLIWKGTNTLETPLTYTVYKTDTKIDVSVDCERVTKTDNGVTMYYEECTRSNIEELGGVVGSGTIPGKTEAETKLNLVINEEIQASKEGTKAYYYVILEYPNLNESQNYDMGGSFNGTVTTEILGEKEMPVVNVTSVEYTEASNGWYSSVTISANATNSNNTVSSINSCITTEEECTPTEARSITGVSTTVTLNESNSKAQRVCFQGVDKNGLKGLIVCSDAYLIDNTSTTTSITLNDNSVLGNNNWYKSVTLDITGNNEVSGISFIKYCITELDSCTPSNTLSGTSISLDSSKIAQRVCAVSASSAGTTSEIECSALYSVDKETPTIELTENVVSGSNGWNTRANITATGSDNISGVTSILYCSTTSSTCEPTTEVSATTYTKEMESNTTATRVCFASVDITGNESETKCSGAYLVDREAPEVTIAVSSNGTVSGSNNWYQSLTLSVTGSDNNSNVSSIKYCTNTSSCTPTTSVSSTSTTVALTSSATGQVLCAQAIDSAGNTGTTKCSDTYNVDTVNPTASINDNYTVTIDSITINVTATDADSKIASYSYTLNGSTYSSCTTATCTFTNLNEGTNYTVGVRVTDISGRRSTLATKAIKTKFEVKDTILAGKTISTRIGFNPVVTSSSTNTIYQAEDDNGTTYYFAGAATDNYVYFANKYWRIIRINGDGTIRLIYDGTSARANGTSSVDTQIGTSAFNTSRNDNAYVGFMYGAIASSNKTETHANTNNSAIKKALDSWYTSSGLSSYAQYIDTNAGFCGDRRTSGVIESINGYGGAGIAATFYASYIRLYNNWTPTFKCANSSDLYTVKGSLKGNKALTYPIGLISAEEVSYAGGLYGTDNTSYYLYTGQDYWTMSPAYFQGSFANVLRVNPDVGIYTASVTGTLGIRPVINLRSDVTLSGSGTTSSPYKVS